MLDGFDVLAISFTAPSISNEWSIAPATLGVVFSAGLLGMTAGAIFIAPYTDVLGRRLMVLIALAVISVAMTLTGLVNSLWQLIVLRGLAGLGIGSMLASLTSMSAEYSPLRRRNLIITFVSTGYPVGATIGGLVAAWMIPEFGWRSVFFAGGALTAAMIPAVILFMPESLHFLLEKQPVKALEKINNVLTRLKQPALESLANISKGSGASPSVKALFTPERRQSTILLWLAFFMCFMTLYFLLSWIPKVVVDAGLSLDKGIFAGITFNVGAFIGVVLLGYLADKKGLRPLIFWFCIIGALLMLAFGFSPAIVGLLLVLSFLLGFFVDGGFAGLYPVAARIYPTEIRTTGVGWAIGAGRTGAIFGPFLGGILIGLDWSISAYFVVFALPLVIAAYATRAIPSDAI
ncbi:MAG: MFS transporter [Gammaproteobacteria bacterium]|nr:MFS transporter [Gammaproteobacteria bacterium]